MRVHLGGHLSWYEPNKRPWLDLHLDPPATPLTVLQHLGVPAGEVAVVTVNSCAAPLEDTPLSDGDTVEFYPPIGGGI